MFKQQFIQKSLKIFVVVFSGSTSYNASFRLHVYKIIIIIIIIIITLSISSKRLFSLIYNAKYLKLSFPKIALKNAVLF